MIKKLLTITTIIGLSACGSSSEDSSGGTTTPNNTAAVISGQLSGSVIEDTSLSVQGISTVSDVDAGESSFKVQNNVDTNYGSFTINASGEWVYQLSNDLTAVQLLSENNTLQDNISIQSFDNTSAIIAINITGNDDIPAINSGEGISTSTIDISTQASVSATLTISDGDEGENAFIEQVNSQGEYGEFSITPEGSWSYQLNQEGLELLVTPLSDTFITSGINGPTQTVVITLIGNIDSGTENTLVKGQIGKNDTVPEINCTTTVTSTSALEDQSNYSMTPGETLCLAAGNYSGLELTYGGMGSELEPITIAAAVPGEVIISGEVSIEMSGEYVVLQGFIFKDGQLDNNVIQTRGNSNTPCHNCRITENAIIDMGIGSEDSAKWLSIYGANNRIDHNWFSGKTTRGALLIVDRYVADGVEVDENFEVDRTLIDHNYFGDRPPAEGKAYAGSSDNEYEAIRIGTSDSHMGDSYSVIEHNYFERIQGEAEVISNKAGHNTIRHNTVRDSNGSIVTRHGEYTTIENNFIIGDDHPFSGGIRAVDGNHSIINNYIEGARYLSSNWNGGIVLSSGNGSTTNGYQNVENVLVANNTIVDSVNSLNFFGGSNSTKPDSIFVINNIVDNAIGPVLKNADHLPTNSVYQGNMVHGQAFSDDEDVTMIAGMSFTDALLAQDSQSLFRPSLSSPDLLSETITDLGTFELPSLDMDGQTRSETSFIGADETLASAKNRGILSADLVGPLSYTPPETSGHVVKIEISNHDFDSGTLSGWLNEGAEITMLSDEVFSRNYSVKLDELTDNIKQVISVTPNTNYTFSAFVRGDGMLVAEVGDTLINATQSNSSYKFTTLSFNSGDATSVTLQAKINDNISNKADLLNPNFNDKNYDNWTFYEGTGIGQIQDSSNSSDSTDGSVKFKYDLTKGDNGTPYNPYIAQYLSVLPNTDYTLSMYTLLKSSHNGSQVTFGVHQGTDDSLLSNNNAVVIASKASIYSDLVSAGAPEADDDFLQDSVTFNSGDQTSITVFAQYDSTTGDEIRIDEFELSYQGAPSSGTTVYFDSFRMVSHASLEE